MDVPVKPSHPPMSQISGVRKLKHTSSFSGTLPKYGVTSPNDEELAQVMGGLDQWGVDVFKISDLTNNKPLTAVTFTILQVSSLSPPTQYYR